MEAGVSGVWLGITVPTEMFHREMREEREAGLESEK